MVPIKGVSAIIQITETDYKKKKHYYADTFSFIYTFCLYIIYYIAPFLVFPSFLILNHSIILWW